MPLPVEFPELVKLKKFGSQEPDYAAFVLFNLRQYFSSLLKIEEVYKHPLLFQFFVEDPLE